MIGCGAVGSLFGANLGTLDDVEVWAYDPWAEHVDAINANGLRLSGAGDVVGHVRATTDPAELPACDFGIVATKSMHTSAALAASAHAFEHGAVCSVQNGAGNEELVAEHVAHVIRGTTFPAGHIVEPGHVGWDTKGDTHIGPFEPQPATMEQVRELADACTRGGMPTHALEDARGAQWRKLIFNATVNTVSALTDLPHVGAFAARDLPGDLGHLVHDLMDEGKAVAAAAGVELHEDPWEMNVHAVKKGETLAAEGQYAHVPSMLEDVRARRPTEIDFITGALVREAERLGVPVPLHTAMYRLIKARESA